MCDDLIAKHFINSATSHKLHQSPEGTTHFTLKPSGRVWLISHTTPTDFAALDKLDPRWTTLNSYDPAVVAWAANWNHSAQHLREMKLDVSNDKIPDAPKLPEGYEMPSTTKAKDWYLAQFPTLAETIHKAGAQVFAISDHTRSIPKKVAWCTIITDKETKRCYISTLEVLPEHRRKGLAQYLISMVARTWSATIEGEGTVWLTVFDSNVPALTLYEKIGFKTNRELWNLIRAGTTRRLSVKGKIDEYGPG
jgi:ribosomal protein S18 acetylase RimI-like enzyme